MHPQHHVMLLRFMHCAADVTYEAPSKAQAGRAAHRFILALWFVIICEGHRAPTPA